MSELDVLEHALNALALCLYAHGPACVCSSCTALGQATALLPRLAHVLLILAAWARGEADETLHPQDIGRLLRMLDDDANAATPPQAGAGAG